MYTQLHGGSMLIWSASNNLPADCHPKRFGSLEATFVTSDNEILEALSNEQTQQLCDSSMQSTMNTWVKRKDHGGVPHHCKFPEVVLSRWAWLGQVILATYHNLPLQKLLIQTEKIPSTNWNTAIVTDNLLLHCAETLQAPAWNTLLTSEHHLLFARNCLSGCKVELT